MKSKFLIGILLIAGLIALAVIYYISQPREISNQEISGLFFKKQIWSGEILITGDVILLSDLTILPGTIVKFAVQDDQKRGYETPADGYNDLDPTRLKTYGENHSSLWIRGRLSAKGTPEKRILFTSASENPQIADWEAIYPQADGSLIEYAIIEWSRNGISPGNEPAPNSIFQNNIIRQTFWGGISLGWSSARVYNNQVSECGHEGIDVQGGQPIIENNLIYNCHTGIVVLRGKAIVKNNIMKNVGNGIHIGGDAQPVLENNQTELALDDSKKEWRFGDFAYLMFGEPLGTPILTEVYISENKPRYAAPGYRLEAQNHLLELPFQAKEWLFYGWKNNQWQKIEPEVIEVKPRTVRLPAGYSMYVLIPEPTEEEKDAEKFNQDHSNIYKIMAL